MARIINMDMLKAARACERGQDAFEMEFGSQAESGVEMTPDYPMAERIAEMDVEWAAATLFAPAGEDAQPYNEFVERRAKIMMQHSAMERPLRELSMELKAKRAAIRLAQRMAIALLFLQMYQDHGIGPVPPTKRKLTIDMLQRADACNRSQLEFLTACPGGEAWGEAVIEATEECAKLFVHMDVHWAMDNLLNGSDVVWNQWYDACGQAGEARDAAVDRFRPALERAHDDYMSIPSGYRWEPEFRGNAFVHVSDMLSYPREEMAVVEAAHRLAETLAALKLYVAYGRGEAVDGD